MKHYRPGNDQNMFVFYVMLDAPVEKKPKASFVPMSKNHLSLVISR